jgi:DNA-binding transcriptional LysR family regulator
MTLEQIKMFVTVAQSGSIAAAAQSLCKTQSAISISLKRLQEELKLELLHREQYRLSLTESGYKLLRHCEFLLKQQLNIETIAQHLTSGLETKIHIVYEAICHSELIFSAIAEVQKSYPLTELYVSSENNLGAIKSLIDGRGDMAISPWMDRFHELADFDTLPFGRFKIITVIHKKAVLRPNIMPTFVSELEHLPLLVPQTMLFQLDLERLFGFVSPSQIRTNDVWAQKAMLMNGAGWGYIPKHLIENELASGELIELKMEQVSFDAYGENRIVKLANQTLGVAGNAMWQALANVADRAA